MKTNRRCGHPRKGPRRTAKLVWIDVSIDPPLWRFYGSKNTHGSRRGGPGWV